MTRHLRTLFSEVPKNYELVNHVITFGLDILWRRKAARIASQCEGRLLLDMCTGTGEMARNLQRLSGGNSLVIGADFCHEMLTKAQESSGLSNLSFVETEAAGLPFGDNALDLITVAFGTRNLNINRQMLGETFREFRRALRPGGRFLIIETSQPPYSIIRWILHAYVRVFAKPVGTAISRSSAGYSYLSHTIRTFYTAEELKTILLDSGFSTVAFNRLLFGIAAIHQAVK